MSGIIETNHCSLCNMYDMSCVLHFSGTGISLSVLAVGFLLSAQASPPVNFYPSDPTSNSTCAQYGWVGQYLICAITVWMGGFPPLIEYNNMSRCTLVCTHTHFQILWTVYAGSKLWLLLLWEWLNGIRLFLWAHWSSQHRASSKWQVCFCVSQKSHIKSLFFPCNLICLVHLMFMLHPGAPIEPKKTQVHCGGPITTVQPPIPG